MSTLYGFILLVFLISTFLTMRRYLLENVWKIDDDRKEINIQRQIKINKIKSSIIALTVVLLSYWVQYSYRFEYSNQALGVKTLQKILDKWEEGKHSEVIDQLNKLSGWVQPWDEEYDQDSDYDQKEF